MPSTESPHNLAAACLLTAAGGFMDAYTYIGHGGVFANAQSGNFVLLGIYLADGKWALAARHVPPILAFFSGTVLTRVVLARTPALAANRAIAVCLLAECAGLVMIGITGAWLANEMVTTLISLLAAVQSASFAKVAGWSYNSAVTTGNLRNLAIAIGNTLMGIDPARNRKGAVVLGLICLSFLIGALAGGVSTKHLGNAAILLTAAAILCVAKLISTSTPRG